MEWKGEGVEVGAVTFCAVWSTKGKIKGELLIFL